ncbi:MAG: YdiU family protein [Pelagibacteraceae bacterium]
MNNFGFNFDNTYAKLPEIMATKISPIPVKQPELVILNTHLAEELGLNFSNTSPQDLANLFSGNILPEGSEPIAQAYCGHQFGHFVMLGDGRAHLLGEHINPKKIKVDIQFKGSGRTPYSRMGDGRAALGPMLREYLISEAMHHLGIPTTRSLAVVKTGEMIRRETKLKGAILTRVAASHLRVGTFQYVAAKQDLNALKQLVDYAVARHYPELLNSQNKSVALFKTVMKRQAKLVTEWLRVGFIHGVMNTDNVSISGETIDYGPCAFMDQYDPKTVFSSIDHYGRYAFGSQSIITKWNLARFAESLLPLLAEDEKKAVKVAEDLIHSYDETFENHFHEMMKKKLGLISNEENDKAIISELLNLMYNNQSDYTNTFRYLINNKLPQNKLLNDTGFITWEQKWKNRIKQNQEEALNLMIENNPAFIPRNHLVEEALKDADDGNLEKFELLLNVLKKPYNEQPEYQNYSQPAPVTDKVYKTFCGT